MLETEYKRRRRDAEGRSWGYTITTAVFFVLVSFGCIASWRYLSHDPYVVATVMVPSIIVPIILLCASINGRKDVGKDALGSVLDLVYWWR